MNIHEDSLALLDSSSTEGVAMSMGRIAASLPEDHWLSAEHRYRRRRRRGRWSGGHHRLRVDLSKENVHSDALAEYIGISAPVHATDGWSLLGRAIHCLLRGDPYSAVHLAYYAELRAAIAVLASQGIGVFDNRHCVIDSAGSCKLVEPRDRKGKPMGSHQWTWQVFRWWAGQQRSADLLRDVIKPEGISLGIWVNAMSRAQPALDVIGTEWLHLWGIDIGRYFADREARNSASYWPTSIDSWNPRTPIENYQAVADMWSMLEPTSESRFTELDKHLLRAVLVDGYFGATERTIGGEAVGEDEFQTEEEEMTETDGFSGEVESLLLNMSMNDPAKSLLKDFLTDSGLEQPAVIQMASGTSKVGESNHVVEVMSRAAMLLRLATGASATLLFDAGIERGDLEFWIQAVGTERGIWPPKEPPDQLVDLWNDVDEVLDDIDSWVQEMTERSAHEMWGAESNEFSLLGECERVALWGLGL